jgi:DUF4097 and DUF4098 domain-containing protein YvlB
VRFNIKSVGALALALAATFATAQDNTKVYREGRDWVVEQSGSVPAARNLVVRSDAGSIQVKGTEQNNVQYTVKLRVRRASNEEDARREAQAWRITATPRGEWVLIEGESERNRNRVAPEFFISAPRRTDVLKTETNGGSIDVSNILGKVYQQTAGGGVKAVQIGGAVSSETMGGSVWVDDISGDALLKTAGGSINIGTVKGKVNASTSGGSVQANTGYQDMVIETAGGSIDVNKCSGKLSATTAGGSIDIGDVGSGAVLETAGGSIRLGSAVGVVRATTMGGGIQLKNLSNGVHAETAAGSIEAEFVSSPKTDSSLETTMGDVIVYLPSNAKVSVRASIEMANGHRIISDFPGIQIRKEGGDWGPSEIYGDGAINGGGPVLKVETTNGNIEFRKR